MSPASDSPKKPELRRHLRQARAQLAVADWSQQSAAICVVLEQLVLRFNLRRVALFWPLVEQREVDLRALDERLRATSVELFYPFMSGEQFGFRKLSAHAQLEVAERGFLQPPASAEEVRELDLIVLPALGLSRTGARLGYGAGFYDRALARFRPPAVAIGVVFHQALLDSIPTEPHDEACDWVITDREQFEVNPGGH